MGWHEVEKHVVDTIKEWEMKLGPLQTDMRLYYPAALLASLFGLEREEEPQRLMQALSDWKEKVRPRLGEVDISGKDRICMTISKEGCEYVRTRVPQPLFLQDLLSLMRRPGAGIDELRALFLQYARQNGSEVCERKDNAHEGVGHIFYFSDADVDPYVYCVSEDAFGLTYHRFSRFELDELTGGQSGKQKSFRT